MRNCKKLKVTTFLSLRPLAKKSLVSEKTNENKYCKIERDGKISYLQYKTVIFKQRTQVS